MSYERVIPRDLFNESRLLKCLGQLALNIHDRRTTTRCALRHEEGSPFEIDQDPATGDLYCTTIRLLVDGEPVGGLYCSYNSKQPYPLYLESHDAGLFSIFNDDGSYHEEFLTFIRDTTQFDRVREIDQRI